MIWKIIFLLSCFDVLVNAGQPSPFFEEPPSRTVATVPFRTLQEWAPTLQLTHITNWTTLQHEPDNDQKDAAEFALKSSKCPTNIIDMLVWRSQINQWPDHLKNTAGTGPNIDNIRTLTCRRIPGAPIVYVGYPDTSNDVE
ncbi:E3 ubiquitin-protein ligase NRDP1-like [Adelges cooleyi]|uniref:E3 ubiquitin-protein ligase NRDP1-like n=1 Tax=Adelges cooleyi TaxID=133065 RepID=UPI00217FC950|nr:E3 ubiquitin-protein ligase NRDP1-like [Adelges cooleyi]